MLVMACNVQNVPKCFLQSLPGKVKLCTKEIDRNKKNCADKVSLADALLPAVALRPPLSSLSTQVSIFFGIKDHPFYLCLVISTE